MYTTVRQEVQVRQTQPPHWLGYNYNIAFWNSCHPAALHDTLSLASPVIHTVTRVRMSDLLKTDYKRHERQIHEYCSSSKLYHVNIANRAATTCNKQMNLTALSN